MTRTPEGLYREWLLETQPVGKIITQEEMELATGPPTIDSERAVTEWRLPLQPPLGPAWVNTAGFPLSAEARFRAEFWENGEYLRQFMAPLRIVRYRRTA